MISFPMITDKSRIGYNLAAISSIIALALGCFAGFPIFHNTGYLDNLKIQESILLRNLFDPLIYQFLSFIVCSILLALWNIKVNNKSTSKIGTYIVPAIYLLMAVVILFLINDFILKEAFQRNRPTHELQQQIGLFSKYIDYYSEGGAPSGYATRGVLIFLVSIFSILGLCNYNKKKKSEIKNSILLSLAGVQLLLLGLTCTTRVLTGYHYWFDIMLGLSLGTLLYWCLLILLGAIINRKDLLHDREYVAVIGTSIIIGFIIIGFFYSQDADLWSLVVIVLILSTFFIQYRTKRNDINFMKTYRKNNE